MIWYNYKIFKGCRPCRRPRKPNIRAKAMNIHNPVVFPVENSAIFHGKLVVSPWVSSIAWPCWPLWAPQGSGSDDRWSGGVTPWLCWNSCWIFAQWSVSHDQTLSINLSHLPFLHQYKCTMYLLNYPCVCLALFFQGTWPFVLQDARCATLINPQQRPHMPSTSETANRSRSTKIAPEKCLT